MTAQARASTISGQEQQPPLAKSAALPSSLARTSKKITFTKNTDIESAFQTIVFNCLDQILENQACLASAYDIENLHQLRVGLRRLRAAFSLFKASLPIPDVLHDELKYFAGSLNPARDWDVFLTLILPGAFDGMGKENRSDALVHLAQQMAHAQQGIACAALTSERFMLSMCDLCLWVHGLGWRDSMGRKDMDCINVSAKKFARKQIGYLQKLVSDACDFDRFKSDEALHKTRIRIKKLRYVMEFFKSFADAKEGKSSLRELSTLQDYLGLNNDLAIANRLLIELVEQDLSLRKSVKAAGEHFRLVGELNKKEMRRYWKKTRLRQKGRG